MIQLYPPIFLNVEFTRSFVREYPVCAREKNVVMPYPTVDPSLFSGEMPSVVPVEALSDDDLVRRWLAQNNTTSSMSMGYSKSAISGMSSIGSIVNVGRAVQAVTGVPRKSLVFYLGGKHGSCEHLRGALNQLMMQAEPHIAVPLGDRKREVRAERV